MSILFCRGVEGLIFEINFFWNIDCGHHWEGKDLRKLQHLFIIILYVY